ncbi:MAG: FG-GAP-like repeat-containing protein, partial [Gemmataceae bacterium]|nr:FG-GAP-like repeat-containing protein [Gemmataceae bacterium]
YAVTLAAGERLEVGLARLSGGAAGVEVLDPAGAVIATGAAPPDATHFAQAAAVTATAPGAYFVRVSTTGALSTEGYVLTAVKNGVIEREGNPEANPQPVALAPTTVIRGGLVDGADQDWYSVSVPAGATLTVSTATPADGPGEYANALNPALVVKQGTSTVGTVVEVGDGRNSFARVTNSSSAAVTYKVGVSGQVGTRGEYLLRATTDADPGPVGVGVGGPYTVAEGGALTLAGAAVDPNGSPLTYTWDLNGDGTFGDATGATPTVPWSALQAFGVNDGPGARAVFLRVSDGTTTVGSTGVVLTVTNAPPAGTPTAGGTVGEAAPIEVGFLSAADPSAADTAAGLRFSYDFDNDGKFDDGAGDGTYAGSVAEGIRAVPADLVADGTGAGNPFSVRVRVLDKDGGFADRTVSFTVVNTPPVAEFADPGVFLENQPGRTLTVGSVADSLADRTAGFLYSVDLDGDGAFDDGIGDGTLAGSVALRGGVVAVPPSFFPEGPATLTVIARIWDKDGASADFSRTVVIANAAPTATFTNTAEEEGGVDEGGAARVSLEGAADPSAADTAAGFRYSFDFNNDGDFTDPGDVADATTAVADVPAARLDDGTPAGVAVRARVADVDGGFTDYTAVIPVRNVDPTADPVLAASGGGAVTIGGPVTVTFRSPFDPSAADTAAGFRYSVDVNNDGVFDNAEIGEVADGTSPVIALPGFETPGDATILVRIADKDGGFNDYPLTVTVANVAPAVSAAAVAPVPEGGAATVRVAASHPSGVTTAAGFRYAYDFDGDGTFDLGTGAGYAGGVKAAAAAIPAALLTDGNTTRTVTVRVFEVNGLSSDVVVPVEVLNVAPVAGLVGPAGRVEVRAPVTFSLVNPADPSPQDTAAGFRYSFDFNNDGDFADPGEVSASASPTATTSFQLTGPYTVRVRVTDKDGGATDYTTTVNVGILTKTWYAAGVGADNPPVVKLYDGDGNVRFSGQVFDASATGGVRVSTADVTGDGTPDLVAATGPGAPAEIAVVDGATGSVVFRVRPFGSFTGGAYVATGDTDGDGKAEIAVSPDEGGGPRVVMYSGAGFRQAASFFGIADPSFRGGARVAMADVNGDGLSDLLVAAGFGGGPRVAGYDGRTVTTTRTKLFNDFFAFDPSLRNGVFLSGGDLNGDGRSELVVGAGPGGGPQVLAFDGAALLGGALVERANFFAQDINNRNGVRVSVADVDHDGLADIVTGDASGPGLNVFRGRSIQASGRPTDEFELFPFDALMNGVFVG